MKAGRTPLVVLALLAALTSLVVIASCGGAVRRATAADFPPGSTMARIRERGVLTVGIKFDHPLFGFKDPAGGRITGFDAEMARLVAKDITGSERDVRFIETMPRNREQFIEQGTVDLVLATYSITPERAARVGFSDPYYYAGQDILVRAGDRAIRNVTDLADRKVCTATGSTSAERLRARAPGAEAVIVNTYSECVHALVSGRIDAISTDDTILLGLMSLRPGSVRLVGKPFGREPYGIGVRRGDTVFRDYLNGLINRYLHDGQWDRAFRDTIGAAGADPEQAKPSR
ncbi:glutamate ABC transporter substrate-binding protein [Spongiactinospora sp. TRM90649]|uniref:glutamate ABC transporter substrate-binding protein n=1 Tax=Spongiactinospora sp. TRM90649 TaxID=3031114 RepID=UPI0023F92104|nr:glutamate ABC transporter substrate-binding protein [Spongiactinospora sp. TRM90649]MDF5758950.1 glutamate ABC transporter substrate-binding protein [Spongiactinospora sp. TRM90649]